ncbi:MAG: amino acid ABC transporter permease [Candidatus Kurthia intestinigallinarum]|uniref:amino acid ABC transporter permease n=1 Tax=Kurthia sp. Dielmo TaxID=1033738 RepID=UPI00210711F0|nr:amino acid ABC transporter permease [Kurthia sp. Dielmo]
MSWDWSVVSDNWEVLMLGAWFTIKISFIALIFSLPIGIIVGFGRIAKNPVIRFLAGAYVEIMRGVPLLVLLMWIYIGLGDVVNVETTVAAVVGLATFNGAFLAEIFRAGVQAVPKGQMEAARASGMTSAQAMRYIILPQAVRRIMPPSASQFIMLIKDSSLISVIGGVDLMLKGKNLVATTLKPLEIYTAIAVIYFIMTFVLSLVIRYFEKRMMDKEQ